MTHVLVVDDEGPARHRLLELLEREVRADIVTACVNGHEALRAMDDARQGSTPVDIVFLDVQMPEMDGFAMLGELPPERWPAVVFVTAYDQYALRAFDVHAIDYLLKPYSDERFAVAFDRAIESRVGERSASIGCRVLALLEEVGQEGAVPPVARMIESSDSRPPLPYLDRIAVRERDRVRLLAVEEIKWIEAEGVYVHLHLTSGRSVLHRSLLGELDAALDPRRFIRIHRSAIVNIDFVDELRIDGRDYGVQIKGGPLLGLGRSYRGRLQARLGQRL